MSLEQPLQLGTTPGSWKNQNILSVSQFNCANLDFLFQIANEMKQSVLVDGSQANRCSGKILANIFYEPSTRTSCSFQAAMLRLGGQVINVNESTSSVKKGETLQDTILSLESYADVIVLRHPEQGSAVIAAAASICPVLNAGDGVGEHPTQALLDLYTIYSEIKRDHLDDLVITMVGDLKHGRTVHSLAKLLSLYRVTLNYVSPEQLKMPQTIQQNIGVAQHETRDLESVLSETDVLYMTRIQRERFSTEEAYDQVKGCYTITSIQMQKMKASCVLMHPLPRCGEIHPEVDADPRAVYFRQMKNGMYIRMALLSLLLTTTTTNE